MHRFCVIAALFAAHADALVLGDVQLNSALGQPLDARIVLSDLGNVDVQQVAIHLASADDYRKLGMSYPEGQKLHFLLVNQPDQTFIRIYTAYPLDEPFVNLLIKLTSPEGVMIKAYTVLLDPPVAETVAAENAVSLPAPASVSVQPSNTLPAIEKQKPRPASKRVRASKGNSMHMKLSMSLSISAHESSSSVAPAVDALQEELIAKEKTLEDLKQQVGAMQSVIKSLPSEVSVASQVPVAEDPGRKWLNPLLALSALMLAVLCFFGYQKYRRQELRGPFDDLAPEAALEPVHIAVPDAVHDIEPETPHEAPVAMEAEISQPLNKVPVGEQSMQVPVYTEHAVPPEYALLMEAKRLLRGGDDKQAEAALIEATKINPKNIFGYQALLRIYESRADTAQFANIAQLIKQNCDESAFAEAAEAGRRIDPDNPLYRG